MSADTPTAPAGVSPATVDRVATASEFACRWMLARPARFAELVAAEALTTPTDRAELDTAAGSLGEAADWLASCRQLRNEWLFRIAWRDLTDQADLEETLIALSDLADVCLEAALTQAETELAERHGHLHDDQDRPQRLIVLGMGKLGGRELNFSSDIDLIFAHRGAGETDGSRPLDAAEYFKRVARRLVQLLAEQTADGFVYRVDTRLRPFGDSGALVASLPALEQYYQTHGREWERYAWIKARPVAGDMAGGKQVIAMLRPFVYRRYLDYSAFESIRDMKALINRQVAQRGMEDNIKLGSGGIREIEFIAQAFQLIRGGHEPALQDTRLLPTLARLGEQGHIPAHVARDLDRAYRFLRRLENRLQAWADQQTHDLPADDDRRKRLAVSMGFEDWSALSTAVADWRRRVHDAFEQVFLSPQTDEPVAEADDDILALWEGDMDADAAAELLATYGIDDAEPVLAAVARLRDDSLYRALADRGQRWMTRLLPLLFGAAAATPEPALAMQRSLQVMEAVTGRTTYVALLVEHPTALSHLVRLCAASPWIAEQIKAQPVLLDSLLDPRVLYRPPRKSELSAALAGELAPVPEADLENRMDLLRRFRQRALLRVAAADVSDAMPLMIVSDHLTELAEVILAAALDMAWSQMMSRYGRPTIRGGDRDGETARFAVIGYGKLGGIELGYGSDLDLVFVHDSTGEQETDGDRRNLTHQAFFLRLAQRLIHVLNTQTGAGRAYEVDMRLRPSGQSGLLVGHIDAFAAYQREQAWTWEHQALVRSRPVAGNESLGEVFRVVRADILGAARDVDKLRREVAGMRRKMRDNLTRREPGKLDLKQTPGGLVDIEFLAQFAVLRYACECPPLLRFSDTIRILETLESAQLLDYDTTRQLTDAYRAYRMRVHAGALQQSRAMIGETELQAERDAVQAAWQAWIGEPGVQTESGPDMAPKSRP